MIAVKIKKTLVEKLENLKNTGIFAQSNYWFMNIAATNQLNIMKEFKDFQIEDFVDMGSFPQQDLSKSSRRGGSFRKVVKGYPSIPYCKHPVSNLSDVL